MDPLPDEELDLAAAAVLDEDPQSPSEKVPPCAVPPGLVKWCRRLGMAPGAVESWGTIQALFLDGFGFTPAVSASPIQLGLNLALMHSGRGACGSRHLYRGTTGSNRLKICHVRCGHATFGAAMAQKFRVHCHRARNHQLLPVLA